MTCYHLQKSPEAYAVDVLTREQTPIEVHLCEWPDANPGRFVDAPTWLLRQIGTGLAVRPEHDCVGCPAFQAGPKGDRHDL